MGCFNIRDHWCAIDRLLDLPYKFQQYIAIPYNDEYAQHNLYSSCYMYDLPWNNLTTEELMNWNRSYLNGVDIVPCEDWVYNYSDIKSSAVTEWNLVCDNLWMKDLTSTIYVAGLLAGSFFVGQLSDRFGRVIIIVVFTMLYAVIGTLSAFSPNYAIFVVLRFLVPVALKGAYLSGFVLALEVTGPSMRFTLGALSQYIYVLGGAVVAGIGYMVRDYQLVQIIMAAPAGIAFTLWWILPESPRWLLIMNRNKEGEEVLRKIALVNGKAPPNDLKETAIKISSHLRRARLDSVTGAEKSEETFLDLFRTAIVRNVTLVMIYNWIVIYVIINAITFNVDSLSGNLYLNILIGSSVEIPAHLLCIWSMQRLGRKVTLIISFTITTLASFAAVPVLNMNDLDHVVTGLSFIMRGGIASALSCASVYTAEIFPTPVRQVSLGMMTSLGNGFGMLAPFLGGFMATIWRPMLYVVCGCLAILGCTLSVILPETLNTTLPDRLQDTKDLINKKPRSNKERNFSETVVSSDDRHGSNNDPGCTVHCYENQSLDYGANGSINSHPECYNQLDNELSSSNETGESNVTNIHQNGNVDSSNVKL